MTAQSRAAEAAKRERSCTRKQPYDTEAEARAGAKARQHRTGDRFHAYPCKYCGHWHIAHDRT